MRCPNCDSDVTVSYYKDIHLQIIQCNECDYEETRDTDVRDYLKKKRKTVKFTVVAAATPEMLQRIKSGK